MMFAVAFALLISASDAPAPAATAATPEKPKKICRVVAERSGTRVGTRKCLTADEWAVKNRDDAAKLSTMDQSYKQTAQ